ncbi:glycosyltransferase [Soonwooa purpurea]
MKVAHLCLSLGKGGAEKLLVDNLHTYKQYGVDVSVIQLSAILEEPCYIAKMASDNIPVVTLGKGSFISLKYIWKLTKLIKKNRYDIVHVHLFPNLYYMAIVKSFLSDKVKLVISEHSVENGRTHKLLFKLIEPYIYKQYDGIIAISKNVQKMLFKRLPKLKTRIFLINNGVNFNKLTTTKAYSRNYLAKIVQTTNEDAVFLMMVSRFSNPKNQNAIVEALTMLPENFYLIFVGDGPMMNDTINLTRQRNLDNRVIFLGFRDDVASLMSSVDFNILSSRHEGFSGVTLEALCSGKMFLGSDVEGINDVVPTKDFLFEENNSKALATLIMKFVNNPAFKKACINEAIKFVKQYDAENMVNSHINLYKSIL